MNEDKDILYLEIVVTMDSVEEAERLRKILKKNLKPQLLTISRKKNVVTFGGRFEGEDGHDKLDDANVSGFAERAKAFVNRFLNEGNKSFDEHMNSCEHISIKFNMEGNNQKKIVEKFSAIFFFLVINQNK